MYPTREQIKRKKKPETRMEGAQMMKGKWAGPTMDRNRGKKSNNLPSMSALEQHVALIEFGIQRELRVLRALKKKKNTPKGYTPLFGTKGEAGKQIAAENARVGVKGKIGRHQSKMNNKIKQGKSRSVAREARVKESLDRIDAKSIISQMKSKKTSGWDALDKDISAMAKRKKPTGGKPAPAKSSAKSSDPHRNLQRAETQILRGQTTIRPGRKLSRGAKIGIGAGMATAGAGGYAIGSNRKNRNQYS